MSELQLYAKNDIIDPHGMITETLTATLLQGIVDTSGIMARGEPADRLSWALQHREWIWPDVKLDFETHKYLKPIYADEHPVLVMQKAAQLGLSEFLITDAFWAGDTKAANALYLLPRTGDVADFSSTRIGLAIEASPYLASIIEANMDSRSGYSAKGRDRATLKRIRNRFLYIRHGGVRADGRAPQLKTAPIDLLVYDEYDEIDARAEPIADKRLQHSKLKWKRYVSTPTYDNRGIAEAMLATDQRVWMVKCEHCGQWQNLDPLKNLIIETDAAGRPAEWFHKRGYKNRPYVACVKCKQQMDRMVDGEWVMKYPSRKEAHGYYLNPLVSPAISLNEIIKGGLSLQPEDQKQWWNQTLGLTYKPRGGGFSESKVMGSYTDYFAPLEAQRCAMGVDVGAKLHVVIRRYNQNKKQSVFIGTVSTFEELDSLVKRYNVRKAVIDLLPETRKAREFIERNKYKAWGSLYIGGATAAKRVNKYSEKEGEEYAVLEIDRSRALDDLRASYENGDIINPISVYREEPDHKRHIMNLTRTMTKSKSGDTYAVWVETGPDHYAHAEVYCDVAMDMLGNPAAGEAGTIIAPDKTGDELRSRPAAPDRTRQAGWEPEKQRGGKRKSAWQE